MTATTVSTLTLDQCRELTGYTPSLCYSIKDKRERDALQLQQARSYVTNRIARKELSEEDVLRILTRPVPAIENQMNPWEWAEGLAEGVA